MPFPSCLDRPWIWIASVLGVAAVTLGAMFARDAYRRSAVSEVPVSEVRETWSAEFIEQARKAVVPISMSDIEVIPDDGSHASTPRQQTDDALLPKKFLGTGCFIGFDRTRPRRALVLTTHQVVAPFIERQSDNPQARLHVFKGDQELTADCVLCHDADRDLALVAFDVDVATIWFAAIAEATPAIGSAALAVAYRDDENQFWLESSIRDRFVQRHAGHFRPSWHLGIRGKHSFTGGPVWDSDGHIVGVVWGHADGLLIATTLSSIQEFLISHQLGYLIHRELSVVRMAQRTKLSN